MSGVRVVVRHVLFVESAAGCAVAGWRLRRGEPLPIDRFDFATAGEAEGAALRLQAYLDAHAPKRSEGRAGE